MTIYEGSACCWAALKRKVQPTHAANTEAWQLPAETSRASEVYASLDVVCDAPICTLIALSAQKVKVEALEGATTLRRNISYPLIGKRSYQDVLAKAKSCQSRRWSWTDADELDLVS